MSRSTRCSYPETKYAGRVAIVLGTGKYAGEKVVIQATSPSGKTYLVRRTIPSSPRERLTYDVKGRVNGATARYKSGRVSVSSVKITRARAPARIDGWQAETLKFMDPYIGMTKAQIAKRFL